MSVSLYLVEDTCDPKLVRRLADACNICTVWMGANTSTATRFDFGPGVAWLVYSTELATRDSVKVSEIPRHQWSERLIGDGVVSMSPHSPSDYVRHELLPSYFKEPVPCMIVVSSSMLPVVHRALTDDRGAPIVIHPGRLYGVVGEYLPPNFETRHHLELTRQIQ